MKREYDWQDCDGDGRKVKEDVHEESRKVLHGLQGKSKAMKTRIEPGEWLMMW